LAETQSVNSRLYDMKSKDSNRDRTTECYNRTAKATVPSLHTSVGMFSQHG